MAPDNTNQTHPINHGPNETPENTNQTHPINHGLDLELSLRPPSGRPPSLMSLPERPPSRRPPSLMSLPERPPSRRPPSLMSLPERPPSRRPPSLMSLLELSLCPPLRLSPPLEHFLRPPSSSPPHELQLLEPDQLQQPEPDQLQLPEPEQMPEPEPVSEPEQMPEPEPVILSMAPPSPQTAIPHPFTSSENVSPTTAIGEDSNNSQPNPRRRRTKQNSTAIEPPYPWSMGHRAMIREFEYLRSKHILSITGEVRCKQCDEKYTMEYDLVEKFEEIASFIERKRDTLHDRAPNSWITPVLPNCIFCNQQNCVEPVIPDEEKNFSKINWLFLLLGQFLGRLKLKQLKYFCAHTNNHRTGAKNRLLYLTYLALCKQLQPSNRLFNVR